MNPTHDETWRARVHLAAANRLAVYDDLEEGIDNHFTMRVPGQDDRYLVLPFGQHWSEARASDLIVFNEAGDVLEGSGGLELSALSIHAPLHRLTGANVILHTHQTWALALNMLEDNRLLPGSQTAAFLTRNIAYDDGYTGLAEFGARTPSSATPSSSLVSNTPTMPGCSGCAATNSSRATTIAATLPFMSAAPRA